MSLDNAVDTPSESVNESIDKATLTSVLVDAFSKLAVIHIGPILCTIAMWISKMF